MRLLLAAAALAVSAAAAGDTGMRLHKKVFYYPPHVETLPGSYIVEFDDHNVAAHAERLGTVPGVAVRSQFNSVFHGAIVAASHDLPPEALANVFGVKRVWPNRKHVMAEPSDTAPITTPFLHEMTGVAKVLSELKINGTGVKIGIVDSGVDYTHPELGNCWKTKGCPWQFGQDFVGDHYAFGDPEDSVKPLPTPMDCVGHGTHVSGIIGARGPQVRGVAPGATLGMYRVISCSNNGEMASADTFIMQGMEAAFKDGHDIISISIGSAGWPEDPISVLAEQIVRNGTVVVAAVGNDGQSGLQTASSPAVGHGVISVGSVNNWNVTTVAMVLEGPDGKHFLRISDPASNNVPFTFDTKVPVVAVGSKDAEDGLGCAKPTVDVTGAIAVVRRGTCTFDEKAQLAEAAGAIGLVVINNSTDVFPLLLGGDAKIPAVTVGSGDGEIFLKSLAAGKSTLVTDSGTFTTYTDPLGGLMSSFSSYGPDPELRMVPVIAAPGGNIWSTYLTKDGSYKSLSGTSMATPYISGVVALLKQSQPKLSVNRIRNMLLSTAAPVSDPVTGLVANPFSSGAGLVNAFRAVQAQALIAPPLLSINSTALANSTDFADVPKAGVRLSVHTLTFNNTVADKAAVVKLGATMASSLSMYSGTGDYAPSFLQNFTLAEWPVGPKAPPPTSLPQVKFDPAELKVDGGGSVKFNVTIAAPYGLDEKQRWFFGGFVTLSVTWDKDTPAANYSVPFGGFNGDYRDVDIFSPPSLGLPALVDQDIKPLAGTSGLVIDPRKPPLLAFSMDVPSPMVWTALIDSKKKIVGYLPEGVTTYVPRTLPETTPVFTIPINNTVFATMDADKPSIVPAGKYRVRLAALRPFGNYKDPAAFQTWDSPVFSFK
ncbi:hypothetical protein H4R18_001166 [Coemansia javaensis]|uniref:Subtilisin-like protease n=1 Tax=Coemansia javaensis TaxID=2761396 RepID=A0A9W8HG20_9FUNG|nr:hypothetical protein H4R18_001166 [Coemansia javaensis]